MITKHDLDALSIDAHHVGQAAEALYYSLFEGMERPEFAPDMDSVLVTLSLIRQSAERLSESLSIVPSPETEEAEAIAA